MKLQYHAKIAVLAIGLLVIALVSYTPTVKCQTPAPVDPLAALAPLLAGLALGALLGGLLGGFGGGGGGGGRRSYGRWGCGKRDVDNKFVDTWDRVEEDMMKDGFELMADNDPSDCMRMLMCEIAAGNVDVNGSNLANIKNFIGDQEANYVPEEFRQYADMLKEASNFGEGADTQTCESNYQCPLTGHQIAEAMNDAPTF